LSTPCGVDITFAKYPTLKVGANRPEVAALECLLKKQGLVTKVDTRYTSATAKAVDRFRAKKHWSRTGTTTRSTWTALLAAGSRPRVLKQGSVGEPVWRLQRALTAAGLAPGTSGVYDARTVRAVQKYRKARKLAGYTTTESTVWAQLRRGKTA
jgi:hypothetical protein